MAGTQPADLRSRSWVIGILLLLLLAALPLAVWLDLSSISENALRRQAGTEQPFRVRMGINTGFCNVGNFGSTDRMDYTIIGAEANLAARLQSVAEPGRIVISYETYALVRGMVAVHALPAIRMKGISREIVPYVIEGLLDAAGAKVQIFSEHIPGLDFFLDPAMVDAAAAERIRRLLADASAMLERRKPATEGSSSAA
jgi:adenylate cyclase